MEEADYYKILWQEESIIDSSGKRADGTRNTPARTPQRDKKDILTWSKFFMSVAFLASERSGDPRTKVAIYDSNLLHTGF